MQLCKIPPMLKRPNTEAPAALQIVKNRSLVGKWFIAHRHPQESRITEGSNGEVGSEGDDVAESEVRDGRGSNQLPWLFSKLSFQVQSAHIARRNTATAAVSTRCLLWSIGY